LCCRSIPWKLNCCSRPPAEKQEGSAGGKGKAFLPEVKPDDVLKLSKEDIIFDIIEKLKEFNYAARTSPD